MARKTHDETLQKIVDERHQTAWTNPKEQVKTDTLGLVIASFLGWDCQAIAQVMLSAFEDANMHDERRHMVEYLQSQEYNVK